MLITTRLRSKSMCVVSGVEPRPNNEDDKRRDGGSQATAEAVCEGLSNQATGYLVSSPASVGTPDTAYPTSSSDPMLLVGPLKRPIRRLSQGGFQLRSLGPAQYQGRDATASLGLHLTDQFGSPKVA
ncbi:hypothetical protein VTK56DRAFT_4462 [Thermocarpiscus australiensis]